MTHSVFDEFSIGKMKVNELQKIEKSNWLALMSQLQMKEMKEAFNCVVRRERPLLVMIIVSQQPEIHYQTHTNPDLNHENFGLVSDFRHFSRSMILSGAVWPRNTPPG